MDFLKDQRDLNYFNWINMENKEILQKLLELATKKESRAYELEQIGKEIFLKNITFSKIAIFFDIFSYKLSQENRDIYRKNLNIFAKGYLQARIVGEIESLKLGIHNNPLLVSQEDIAIIEEMLTWLDELTQSFLDEKKTAPKISQRVEIFEEFVEKRAGIFFDNEKVKEDFLRTSKELYECAEEAVNFFEREEYYHFMLIYVELIALFLKMVTLLSGMFLEESLLSIYIDPITGLANRFQLLKDVSLIQDAYIMIINFKSFAKLNISYGYEIGDVALKRVATFLQSQDIIKAYRIYADEFAVLVESKEEAHKLFEKLNSEVSINIEGIKYDIFFYGAYSKFQNRSLEVCEFALAKGDKRGLVDSQNIESMMKDFKTELTMLQKLKEVMISDNIVPFYQPIYADSNDHKVIKYEVLMRVKYDSEFLSPADFMQTLVESPFYVEFTKSILLKAFETFENNNMTFSVNFTVTDILDKSLRLFLETLIKKYPEVAKRLTIEITESEAIEEFEKLQAFIEHFRQYGVTFSLDDFGSGYSNFAQIAKLPIDYLKIDGSIIADILENKKMQHILASILEFSKSLHLKTIAEYVSSREIFEYLQGKVDMMQGYYIGKPEPFLDGSFSVKNES